MRLMLYRHLWGVDEPWETVFPKIKENGYHGIETHLLPSEDERRRFGELLRLSDFRFIAMIFTAGKTVDEHLSSFEKQIAETLPFEPTLINCHSGVDAWSEEQSSRFFEGALEVESKHGVSIAHETHRGRILFNPWITASLLDRFDELKLCCDFSHWVCVCERLIDDQTEIIKQCADRAIHLHARVGYDEGPQVPDPRAPEYKKHLEAHEQWGNMIWAAQKRRGLAVTSLTPEFGPPPYLQTLTYTNMPVANLWDICNWQAKRQSERFAAKFGVENM